MDAKKAKFRVGDKVRRKGDPECPVMTVTEVMRGLNSFICRLDATIRVMDGNKYLRDINWMFEEMLERA